MEENQTMMGIVILIPESGGLVAPQSETKNTSIQVLSEKRLQEDDGVSVLYKPYLGAVSHNPANANGCCTSIYLSLRWKIAVRSQIDSDETGSDQKFLCEWPVDSVLQFDKKEESLLNLKCDGLCQIIVWYRMSKLEGVNQGRGEE